jgi:2-keto-4-pentenoate hydratase/2-oxohepta-3-ene-1,7-dioic acid hydratase in catechol pathway
MRYVRAKYNGKVFWGRLETNSVISFFNAAPYNGGSLTGEQALLSDCILQAPCEPGKIVAVGKNYRDHIRELAGDTGMPENPILFLKPASSIIGPKEPICLPPVKISQRIDYEGELALVIGKTAKNITADEADSFVFGFTCLNDVTARDIQRQDGQWTRSKSFDTFAPIGPWLESEIKAEDLAITTTLNGVICQQSRTSEQLWSYRQLLEFISQMMTLEAGDIVTTGTPAGIAPMKDGDQVCVEIEGIGRLQNPVIQS